MTNFARANMARGPKISDIDGETFFGLPLKNPEQLFFVASTLTPSIFDSFEAIENLLYPPDTKKNKYFELIVVNWPSETSLQWGVCAVPIMDKADVVKILRHFDLTLIRDLPRFFDGKKHVFPIADEFNVYAVVSKKEELLDRSRKI
jgi:hypothetical protein